MEVPMKVYAWQKYECKWNLACIVCVHHPVLFKDLFSLLVYCTVLAVPLKAEHDRPKWAVLILQSQAEIVHRLPWLANIQTWIPWGIKWRWAYKFWLSFKIQIPCKLSLMYCCPLRKFRWFDSDGQVCTSGSGASVERVLQDFQPFNN